MTPEAAFAIALVASVLALAYPAYREWRDRETDKRMRRGFKAARRMGYLPTDSRTRQ